MRNVWYDTAASPLIFPTCDIFDVALRCIDHRKILHASDYPLRLYPRRQPEPDFRPFLAEIDVLVWRRTCRQTSWAVTRPGCSGGSKRRRAPSRPCGCGIPPRSAPWRRGRPV